MAKAKYLEVADELKKRIENDVYSRQEPLPDQEAFAEEFNVSCQKGFRWLGKTRLNL